jgi:ornithine cyclodeaminase
MTVTIIGPEAEAHLTWDGLVQALIAGHARPRADIADTLLYRGGDTLLNRAAWIDGLGLLAKSATIFPGNAAQGKPVVNGGASLFSDTTGELEAVIDFHLLTKWKTAGDSLLSARQLARPDSRAILIVGAGTVARSMADAYRSAFADVTITFWNRSAAGAEVGRSERIRTSDPLLPKQVRYQAALRSDRGGWVTALRRHLQVGLGVRVTLAVRECPCAASSR